MANTTNSIYWRQVLTFFPLMFVVTCCFTQQRAQNPEYTKYNPSYHFYPTGDPTGLFYFAGKYYNQWGAAHSIDLVHWQRRDGSQSARLRLNDSTLSQAVRDSLRARLASSRATPYFSVAQ
jgi:hypothetical protein